MKQEELKNIVEDLTSLKKEGTYWDFKREPHKNNAELLHDILCLANALYEGDRYLIIGIDEENDYQRYNLNHDEVKKRKTQADLMDFLSKIPFAGDNVPKMKLETLYYDDNVEIDVIVIKNEPYKPYYLTKDYQKTKKKENGKDKKLVVRNGVIYSRKNDKNVPMKKSTNIYMIEKMWRERFGLDDKPLDRLEKFLLEPENWVKDFGNKEYGYYKYFPEFNFKYKESHDNYNSFKYFFEDTRISYIGIITFFYHSTILYETEIAILDGFRIFSSVPQIKCLKFSRKHRKNTFYYFIEDNFTGSLLFFFQEKFSLQDRSSIEVPIPIFENEEEMNKFINSINVNDHEDKDFNFRQYIWDDKLEKAEISSGASLKTTIKIYELYQEWKERSYSAIDDKVENL